MEMTEGGRRDGGYGTRSSANVWAWHIFATALILAALALGITGVVMAANNHHRINDNDDDIDDIMKVVDVRSGGDVDIRANLDVKGDIDATGDLNVTGSIYGIPVFAKSFPVCAGGSVSEGTAVSLNGDCVTSGFDPHPCFVENQVAAGIVDKQSVVPLGSNGEAVIVYGNGVASGDLTARLIVRDGDEYDPAVVAASVAGTGGAAVGATTSWAAAAADDTHVMIVRNAGNVDNGVDLTRCTISAGAITCDSGVVLLSTAAATNVRILGLNILGFSGSIASGVVNMVDLDTGALMMFGFSASTTFNTAAVGIGATVTVDTDADYAAQYLIDGYSPMIVVPATGTNHAIGTTAYAFSVVYGGIDAATGGDILVETYSVAVSTGTITTLSAAANTIFARVVSGDDLVEFDASGIPGTNAFIVTVTDPTGLFQGKAYTLNAVINALHTAGSTTYQIPGGASAQGLIYQAHLYGTSFPGGATGYHVVALSDKLAIFVIRATIKAYAPGMVVVVKLDADAIGVPGKIVGFGDRAIFSAGAVGDVVPARVSNHKFMIASVQQDNLGTFEEESCIVLGELPSSHSENGVVEFGLGVKGQHVVGIASESALASEDVSVVIAGQYCVTAASPLAALEAANIIYAYGSDGSLGTSFANPSDVFSPVARVGTHIGDGCIYVTPEGANTI